MIRIVLDRIFWHERSWDGSPGELPDPPLPPIVTLAKKLAVDHFGMPLLQSRVSRDHFPQPFYLPLLSISFRRIYRITPLCTSVLLASNSIKPILWKLSIRLAIAAFLSLSPLLSWLHQSRILWSSFSSRWIFLRRGREIKIFSGIFHPFFHEIFLETCDLCNISGWRGEGFFIFHVAEAYCAPWKAFETRLGTFRGEIRLVEIWRGFHLDKLFPRATSSIE